MSGVGTSINDALRQVSSVQGVTGIALAGIDGLLIDGLAEAGTDLDVLAAGGSANLQPHRVPFDTHEKLRPNRVVIEIGDETLIVERLGEEALVAVRLQPANNLGYIKYLLATHHEAFLAATGEE